MFEVQRLYKTRYTIDSYLQDYRSNPDSSKNIKTWITREFVVDSNKTFAFAVNMDCQNMTTNSTISIRAVGAFAGGLRWYLTHFEVGTPVLAQARTA